MQEGREAPLEQDSSGVSIGYKATREHLSGSISRMRVGGLSFLIWGALWSGCHMAFDPLFPLRKTWWAKHITPYLYTAGRITDRQMKQAADVGFKSIISHYTYDDNMTIGEDVSYATDLARHVAKNIAGLEYEVLFSSSKGDTPLSESEIARLTDMIKQLDTPIIYHCDHSNASTFYALLHVLFQNKRYSSFQYKMDALGFFETAANLGYRFIEERHLQIVSNITKAPIPDILHIEYMDTPDWFMNHSWIVKPVYKNIYAAGQIQRNYIPFMTGLFGPYFNLRRGAVSELTGEPIQEEVTLLNVNDRTGTYTNEGRQLEKNLIKARIVSTRPNDYIHFGSTVNFEARNPLEFGDDIGYNETISRLYIENVTNFKYIHTPIGEYNDPITYTLLNL